VPFQRCSAMKRTMKSLHPFHERGILEAPNRRLADNFSDRTFMKILLQHIRTLHYLRADGSWTRNHTEARNFVHSATAIHFAFEHKLTHVYVAVKFPGSETVTVPLPAVRPPVSVSAISLPA
jgi:hypothetical protein